MDKEGVAAQLGLRWKPSAAWAVAIAVGFFLALVNMNTSSTFLYFQF